MYKWVFFIVLSCVAAGVEAKDAIRPKTHDLPPEVEPVASMENELGKLQDIMQATAKNLENQKRLYSEISDYMKVHERYLENTNDKRLSYQMVMKAHSAFKLIQSLHLTHAFDQDLISELAFFSNIAERWNTPESQS